MRIRTSNLLPLGLMFLLAALTLWLRVVMEPGTGPGNGHDRHDPDAMVENFRLTRLDENGVPQYTLTAAGMVHYADDDSTELSAPQLTRKTADSRIAITSNKGTVTRDGEEAFFRDNVLIVRSATPDRAEMRLQTEYLHVLAEKNVARTDHPVVITEGKSILTGVGMEFDDNARRFSLSSRVRGTFDQARK